MNYSDFEGSIDFNIAELLYQDYEELQWLASILMDNHLFGLYCKFMETFKLASEGKGIVMYN